MPGRPGIIAALDVGSSKVACFIAKVHEAKSARRAPVNVIGVGHQVSRGVKCGAVVDMVEVEESIRSAVDQAERMAGVTIHEVVASFSAGAPRSFMAVRRGRARRPAGYRARDGPRDRHRA